jgi:hypothetical protein
VKLGLEREAGAGELRYSRFLCQCSAVRCSTVQYSALQCSAASCMTDIVTVQSANSSSGQPRETPMTAAACCRPCTLRGGLDQGSSREPEGQECPQEGRMQDKEGSVDDDGQPGPCHHLQHPLVLQYGVQGGHI